MNNVKQFRIDFGLTQGELADKLGVNIQTVWSWENQKYNPKGKRLRALALLFGVPEAEIINDANKNRIAVLGSVHAGIPLEAIEDIVDYEEIPTDWHGEYFGLKVCGDSMSPKYLDGDTIICKVQSTCASGQDCVVRVNGFDATLKTVVIGDGFVELVPYNSQYETTRFNAVDIIGVVVELRRKIQ